MPLGNTLSEKSIVSMIAEMTTQFLLLELQSLVSRGDPTLAGLVRTGLLQQSPLSSGGINILTQYNDPDDENAWRHSIIAAEESHKIGLMLPAYEIGGGQMWFRRYTTKLTLFFKTGDTRESAQEEAQIIMSRAENAILTSPLPTGGDSYGEYALQNYLYASKNIEGGGPGQFIFYGCIWWQTLCEKQNTFHN